MRRRIKMVRPTRYGRIIELYDAMAANLAIAKGLGVLRDRHEVQVTRSQEDILAEVNELERERESSCMARPRPSYDSAMRRPTFS